jgi:hypothetical protein
MPGAAAVLLSRMEPHQYDRTKDGWSTFFDRIASCLEYG